MFETIAILAEGVEVQQLTAADRLVLATTERTARMAILANVHGMRRRLTSSTCADDAAAYAAHFATTHADVTAYTRSSATAPWTVVS